MAYQISWTASAWQDLEEAAGYIARDSEHYAAALVEDAREAARSLQRSPLRGRIVPELGDVMIRELFVKSYRLMYRVRGNQVVVLAFLHGARRFPI